MPEVNQNYQNNDERQLAIMDLQIQILDEQLRQLSKAINGVKALREDLCNIMNKSKVN